MDVNELENRIATDLAVELADEFDRNFERKAYFNDKWPDTKLRNPRGSLLMRTGNLRRSIRYNVRENMVTFSSSLPYASINNEGGEIEVTEKMKKFFWAMFYKAAGAVTKTAKGEKSKSKRNERLTAEAAQWKALALMKVGHKMKIPKRQVVGGGPMVDNIVKTVLDDNIQKFTDDLVKQFQQ